MSYSLVHRGEDRHVLSSDHDRYSATLHALASVTDSGRLIKLIELLLPSANFVAALDPRGDSPSQKLLAAFPSSVVTEHAQHQGITLLEAAGAIVRNGTAPSSLEFLRAIPPEDIHAMQRGPYWIGDFYSSDLVISAFCEAGIVLSPGALLLDYGCSSGSLLRVMAWAYPELRCFGTDPVRPSIEWAKANLRRENICFRHQEQRPPLAFDDRSFDLITAISIFSHHGLNAAAAWFDELARILKPGGAAAITTHGPGSLLFYAQQGIKPVQRYREIFAAMLANGYAFEEVWMQADDVGNVATEAEWGNSFLAPDVVYSLTADRFDIALYRPRANQNNQDLYVLRRR